MNGGGRARLRPYSSVCGWQRCGVHGVVLSVAAQASIGAPNLTVALETILEESGNSKLAAYAAVLNGLLPVTMPATSASSTIKGKRRDRMICALMMAVLRHLVVRYPAVIVIDDGHLMNPASWDFAAQVGCM